MEDGHGLGGGLTCGPIGMDGDEVGMGDVTEGDLLGDGDLGGGGDGEGVVGGGGLGVTTKGGGG